MMRTWAGNALYLIERDEPAAMVTIAAAEGSAPREAGTRMIVTGDMIFGTIGGGNLEFLLADQARRLLASDANFLQQDYPLGPLLAQCCGGRVRVLIERLTQESRGWLELARGAMLTASRFTLEGRIVGSRILRTVTVGWSTPHPTIGLYRLDGAPAGLTDPWMRIVERIQPIATRLYVFGAGHVGRAVVRIAETLPFRLNWFDSRPELAGAHKRLKIRDDLPGVVADARKDGFFLVLTHAHELDYQLVRAILGRGDARYCGLIGSATKRARFLSRLAKDGVDASGLTCPIGGGVTRSKEPAAIAVATSAELLMRLEAAEAGSEAQNSSVRRTSP